MRLFVGGLLFAVSLSAAENPVTLETRTQQHVISVEVRPEAHYTVRIVDLKTNQTIFLREMIGVPAETMADEGDRHVTVRLGPAPYGITTSVEIEHGDMVVDSLHTVWTLTPHRARLRSEGAMRVGGDVKAPVVMRRVDPVYSDEARRDRISGIVIIEALIDKTGTVRDAIVLKGLPHGLSEAALAAVKQWQFQPATLAGEPVDVIFNLTMNFKLDSVPVER